MLQHSTSRCYRHSHAGLVIRFVLVRYCGEGRVAVWAHQLLFPQICHAGTLQSPSKFFNLSFLFLHPDILLSSRHSPVISTVQHFLYNFAPSGPPDPLLSDGGNPSKNPRALRTVPRSQPLPSSLNHSVQSSQHNISAPHQM
jgi:hypothetical protein